MPFPGFGIYDNYICPEIVTIYTEQLQIILLNLLCCSYRGGPEQRNYFLEGVHESTDQRYKKCANKICSSQSSDCNTDSEVVPERHFDTITTCSTGNMFPSHSTWNFRITIVQLSIIKFFLDMWGRSGDCLDLSPRQHFQSRCIFFSGEEVV